MNTYAKYTANVFVAKCDEKHEKGDVIILTTKYGKEHDCIVFNYLLEKDGFYYYSIVRADGFNAQEFARRRAEKLQNASLNAEKKADEYWEASNEGRDFLSLGEPIKVGHHSEKKHRALIERNHARIEKAIDLGKKAESYESRIDYWESKSNDINLSMPESIDYFEYKLEKAIARHEGLKNGTIEREHSFSLTYAKKEVNELQDKVKIAKKLWE